jgi:hypothetical protein
MLNRLRRPWHVEDDDERSLGLLAEVAGKEASSPVGLGSGDRVRDGESGGEP